MIEKLYNYQYSYDTGWHQETLTGWFPQNASFTLGYFKKPSAQLRVLSWREALSTAEIAMPEVCSIEALK